MDYHRTRTRFGCRTHACLLVFLSGCSFSRGGLFYSFCSPPAQRLWERRSRCTMINIDQNWPSLSRRGGLGQLVRAISRMSFAFHPPRDGLCHENLEWNGSFFCKFGNGVWAIAGFNRLTARLIKVSVSVYVWSILIVTRWSMRTIFGMVLEA